MRIKTGFLVGLLVFSACAPLAQSQNRIDAAQLLLPISLAPEGQQATIVDMDLCGSNGSAGSFLSVILPGAQSKALLLDQTACNIASEGLAKHIFTLYPAVSWIGIGTMGGAWSNYNVTLSSGTITIYGRDLSIDAPLSAKFSSMGSVLVISTESVTISSGNQKLVLAAKLWFTGSGITASLFPIAAKAEGVQALLPVFDQQAGGMNDTIVRLGYSDANYFYNILSPGGFDVPTSAGTVHIASLQISGSTDDLTSSALLSSAGLPNYNATITANGDDLMFASISTTPALDCSGKTGIAKIQCQLQYDASKAAGDAISQRLTAAYKGYPLRPTGETARNSITLGNVDYWLNSTMTKCHASNDALYLMGTLSVEERK